MSVSMVMATGYVLPLKEMSFKTSVLSRCGFPIEKVCCLGK